MKLFVWNNPVSVSYGGTCLYVVAEDEAQARELATKAKWSKFGHAPDEKDRGFDKELGAPDRIIDAPCAEVYYWSE